MHRWVLFSAAVLFFGLACVHTWLAAINTSPGWGLGVLFFGVVAIVFFALAGRDA